MIQFWIARAQTLNILATSRLLYIGCSGRFWMARMDSRSGYLAESEFSIVILFPGHHRLQRLHADSASRQPTLTWKRLVGAGVYRADDGRNRYLPQPQARIAASVVFL